MPLSSNVEQLARCLALEIEILSAFEKILEQIDVISLYRKVAECKGSHERHYSNLRLLLDNEFIDLSAAIDSIRTRLEGIHNELALSSGNEGALKSFFLCEKLSESVYAEALADPGVSEEARPVFAQACLESREHLSFANWILRERLWERSQRQTNPT